MLGVMMAVPAEPVNPDTYCLLSSHWDHRLHRVYQVHKVQHMVLVQYLCQILRVMGVTAGDNVGGQGLGHVAAVLHGRPQAGQDDRGVLGRRHAGHGSQGSSCKSSSSQSSSCKSSSCKSSSCKSSSCKSSSCKSSRCKSSSSQSSSCKSSRWKSSSCKSGDEAVSCCSVREDRVATHGREHL